MTQEKLVILKTYLTNQAITDTALAIAITNGDDVTIQSYLNTITSTYGWRTNVTPEEYLEVIDWTEISALTVGAARVWEWITSNQTRILDFSRANNITGLASIFTNATAPNTRAGLLSIASRLLTVAEELLVVSNAAAGTAANAKTMTFEGNVTIADASLIRVGV